MTVLDTLITDRTQEDVNLYLDLNEKGYEEMFPDERAAWDAGLKGAYDYRDMNRVREAVEYIDRLMTDAKRESVYEPVIIPHKVPTAFGADGMATQWKQWNDKVWIDYDFPSPALWAAHLSNISRLWAAARRFTAIVPPRYDPDGTGYIKPDAPLDAGKLFRVLESVGLLELRVVYTGPPIVTASGAGWTVEQTVTGWTARMDYPNGPFPDIGDTLAALGIICGGDGMADGTFTLAATLRYGYGVTAGTCAVRWSPFIIWREAQDKYGTWGGTKPLAWGEAGRGEEP